MIGANNSPLNMFTRGNESGPSMYEIGYNASPGGGVANALRTTIDRYHQELAAQQEQANKLEQIKAQGVATLGNEKSLVDYKTKAELEKAAQINDMNKKLPNSGLRTVDVGGRTVYLQDQADDSGRMVSKEVQPAPLMTMDQILAQKVLAGQSGSPIPGVPAAPAMAINPATPTVGGQQATIRVRTKDGQTGTIPANEFDPKIYERI